MIGDNKIKIPNFSMGFTLIELVVSMAIFGTIATLVLANLRGGSQRNELSLGATTLSEAIREAMNRTNAGELIGICVGGINNGKVCPGAGCGSGGSCVDTLPLGGFGISLSQLQPIEYTIFADLNNNLGFDAGEEVRTGKFINTATVTISDFSTGGSALTISFRPPKPTAYINGTTAVSSANINLKHRFLSETQRVHFERMSGAVGVQ